MNRGHRMCIRSDDSERMKPRQQLNPKGAVMFRTFALFADGSRISWCATPHRELAALDRKVCAREWSKRDSRFVRAVSIKVGA